MSPQQIVIDHLPLAAAVAGSIHKRLPRYVERQDIRQEACIGLMDAAIRYDARKAVPFKVYARRRISGAVLDGLRREDYLSRHERARIKADGAEPSVYPLQLSDPSRVSSTLLAPDQYAATHERDRLLAAVIHKLPARLRFLVRAYYFEEKVMHEIGVELGVNESRVSQLHALAIRLLRGHFAQCGLTSIHPFTPEVRS